MCKIINCDAYDQSINIKHDLAINRKRKKQFMISMCKDKTTKSAITRKTNLILSSKKRF